MEPDSQACEEGFDAFIAGVSRFACPYRPSVKVYYDWLIGWDDAKQADLEKKNPT